TLITVEENLMASNRPTSVAVHVNTGAVDLSTPNWTAPGSRAAVSVEDAKAELRPNSRAAVKLDKDTKESEIVVSNGSAQVRRGRGHHRVGCRGLLLECDSDERKEIVERRKRNI